MKILITGGAGFIGSALIRHIIGQTEHSVLNVDKLTYAGNLESLTSVEKDPRYTFLQADICDGKAIQQAFQDFQPDIVMHLAAETHVDRSILDPDAFIRTGVYGTYVLLEATRKYGLQRYHQISTDEVYGHIPAGYSSKEDDKVDPRSPYAASKASGDLMVNAYFITYGLPVTITRGSNNIGPYQYPEKVIPLFATNAIDGLPLPVYGDGRQMREYQYVIDHCEAIDLVLTNGNLGEVYNIGTGQEMENLQMVEILLQTLNQPRDLIRHVQDRPGHDRRYSLNIDKIRALGWKPRHTPAEAIAKTAQYL